MAQRVSRAEEPPAVAAPKSKGPGGKADKDEKAKAKEETGDEKKTGKKDDARADRKEDRKDAKKADEKEDKKDDDYEDPESYAVLGPKGGVPTHPEGPYRSPYAHPHWGTPAKVRVGIVLNQVHDYDIKEGTFQADFFLSMTSEKPMPRIELTFPNGKVEKDDVDLLTDKPTFKMYRFAGTFRSPPNLRQYPFDTQDLVIEVEDHNAGIDQLQFVPDEPHTHLGVGFGVTGWSISHLRARAIDFYYPDRFDDDDLYYSRFKLSLGVTRYGTSAAFTVFVPAIVIVLISLSGLWLPREELEVRSNASVPMLAAAVLFHFALMQALLSIPYLTRADKVMMVVYVSLILNMLATWAWFVFDEKHTETVFLWGRRIVPPATIIAMIAGTLL